jgi:hypothetical protein
LKCSKKSSYLPNHVIVYYDVDNINAKKESFGHFETNEAALWRRIAAAKQGSTDYLELQKSHKKFVKLMDGIVTYFIKYTEPTTDPTALASGSTATSAALAQSQRVQRPAFGDSAMAPPPTELDHITTGASMTASTAASKTALASGSTATSAAIGPARERAQRMIDATALEYNLDVIAATSTALASNTAQLIAEDQAERSERQATNKRRHNQLRALAAEQERALAADATTKSSMAGVAEAALIRRLAARSRTHPQRMADGR